MMKKIFFLLLFLVFIKNLGAMEGDFYQVDPSVCGDFSPDGALFLNIMQLEREGESSVQMLGLYNLRICGEKRSSSYKPDYLFRPDYMFDDDSIVGLQWSPCGDYVAIVGHSKRSSLDHIYIYDAESLKNGHYRKTWLRGKLKDMITVPGMGNGRPPILIWNPDNSNLVFVRYNHPFPERYEYQVFVINVFTQKNANFLVATKIPVMAAWDANGEILALLGEEERGFYSVSDGRREFDPFFYFDRENHQIIDFKSLNSPVFLTQKRFFNVGMKRFNVSHESLNEKENKLFFIDSLGKCEIIARILNKGLRFSAQVGVGEIEKGTELSIATY